MAVRRSARQASATNASSAAVTNTGASAPTTTAQQPQKDSDDTSNDAQASVPTTSKPLKGCAITLSGNFRAVNHNLSSMKKLVEELGGLLTTSVTNSTTHLVIPENQLTGNAAATARSKGIMVMEPRWVTECQTAKQRLPDTDYDWFRPKRASSEDKDEDSAAGAASSTAGLSTAAHTKQDTQKSDIPPGSQGSTQGKRGHSAGGIQKDDSEDEKPKVKKQKTLVRGKGKDKVQAVPDPEPQQTTVENGPVAEGQFAKDKSTVLPIDEFCQLQGYQVYIDQSTGMIYDASLNQTHASRNNNKFYRDQVVFNPATKDYRTWTRWGRVGDVGQHAQLGDGTLKSALDHFEKKFKDKTGLKWENRGDDPKTGKYAFVERSYDPDSDDEEESSAKDSDNNGVKDEPDDSVKMPKCTLEKPVQDLVELIFNQTYFQNTMANLNYDADKLPLGKLGKNTILRGFQQLKDLAALLDDPNLATSKWQMPYSQAVEHLSNTYYSLIPHNFRRNRPPVIGDNTLLKKEVELLESLSDMKAASDIMKVDRSQGPKVHPTDRQYMGLNLKEMTTLDHSSQEFKLLDQYLNGTRGETHNVSYDVQDIWRIERPGEQDRFDNSAFSKIDSDRRLLWHGSRVTNFGGILSQGLRIAPPEAPVSGYMFGKGIYLADMSSKSAGYCCSWNSNQNALLLLCDAELGKPMQELVNADYDAGSKAKSAGKVATHGLGNTGPNKWVDAGVVHPSLKGVRMPDPNVKPGKTKAKGAGLYYNEYIAYDVAQVRLRYLLRVKM